MALNMNLYPINDELAVLAINGTVTKETGLEIAKAVEGIMIKNHGAQTKVIQDSDSGERAEARSQG